MPSAHFCLERETRAWQNRLASPLMVTTSARKCISQMRSAQGGTQVRL